MFAQPVREVTRFQGNEIDITVTPPPFIGGEASVVTLTKCEYQRFLDWQSGNTLIQEALPSLTPDQREILLTGINAQKFTELFGEEE